MAYNIEKEENGTQAIVIDEWEGGIADSPEKGISFMRNINLVSSPGEAVVNFRTSSLKVPANISNTNCTFDTATNSVTWSAGTIVLYSGTSVIFSSTVGGVTAGVPYWISSISGNTFKIYTNISHSTQVLVTNASNTFSTVTFSKGKHKTIDLVNKNVFLLDGSGRAWSISIQGELIYLGNTTLTATHGDGMAILGDFLFVFRDNSVDYFPLTYLTSNGTPLWVYGWNGYTISTDQSTGYSHYAITAQDNGIYFCNGQSIQSILVKGGSSFDPTLPVSYTTTLGGSYALLLPSKDRSVCIAELGNLLIIGGIENKLYPWDRISTTYRYPLILSENYTTRMVTSNATTYIFAGNRGRIYQTNGANVQLFKKIPDHIVNIFTADSEADPYYTWLDAVYWKNQIYFSFLAYKNDGTQIKNIGGLWAIDISFSQNIGMNTTAVGLRMTNTLSVGTAIEIPVIIQNIKTSTPGGAGLYIAWSNLIITEYGVDITTSNPYTTNTVGGEIYTDLIRTGTSVNQKTFGQVEFKLARPLVSGEMVRISARQSLGVGFTVIGNTTTVGALSDVYQVSFQTGQWIQMYVELFSSDTTPSFVRLKEVRIR